MHLCDFPLEYPRGTNSRCRPSIFWAGLQSDHGIISVLQVVKFKRNPVPIREAMGFNEDPGQPLFRADKPIRNVNARVDPDKLEDFIEVSMPLSTTKPFDHGFDDI